MTALAALSALGSTARALLLAYSALNGVALLVGLWASASRPAWFQRLEIRWFHVIVYGAIGFTPLLSASLAKAAA
ncbi:MAG: hypothetical protein JOZ37_09070 [Actinobacteria bacterium]|nr:hypothetical protein [Actinomycetota bacterium]MBV8959057.1 hypothetical protein [Actinomycetota bacterium]MBV9252916.1 hypothetical protein [Actinomycetota bacterium]MBV9664105.1 hypothetical protein [Actinomycetota bacterium]MBV9936385.1 hypothetical protein [Actinomycetota bacterium]